MELPQELVARNEATQGTRPRSGSGSDRDVARVTAKATAAAIVVGAIGFGLWEVRSMVILLLLSLTFAAAIRPGVEWLNRHRVPQPAAILSFFLVVARPEPRRLHDRPLR